VLLGGLSPFGIMHPDAIGALVIFSLKCREKLVDDVLLRPVTESPHQQHYHSDYRVNDNQLAAPLARKVRSGSIEQSHHTLSIRQTGSIVFRLRSSDCRFQNETSPSFHWGLL